MGFKLALISCMQPGNAKRIPAAKHIVETYGCSGCFFIDDMPYMNAKSTFGTPVADIDETATVADFEAHYDNMYANPDIAKINNAMDVWGMVGDHSVAGNDWDHMHATATAGGVALSVTDDLAGQNIINQHYAMAMEAFQNKYPDNPANTDVLAVPEIPSGALTHGATPNASDYRVLYFRLCFDINGNIVPETADNIHLVIPLIDTTSYRDPLGKTDDTNKTMLGANQLAWLQDGMSIQATLGHVLASPVKLYSAGVAENSNIWEGAGGNTYIYERDNKVLDPYEAAGTALSSMSGDRHTPQFQILNIDNSFIGETNDARNHVSMTACPVGNDINANAGSMVQDKNTRWFNTQWQVFGLLEVEDTYYQMSICRAADGRKMKSYRVGIGSSAAIQPAFRMA